METYQIIVAAVGISFIVFFWLLVRSANKAVAEGKKK